jgi:DNA-binding PadR family transcriptional regulator
MEKELVLLGLLKEGPKHGYELKRIVDETISTFAPISAGSIYYTLKALAKRGLVTTTRKRQGRYPEKEVYKITGKGAREFKVLLKRTSCSINRLYRSLDIVLYFMDYLAPEEMIEGLRKRIRQIARIREATERISAKIKKEGRPYYIQAIAQRNIRFMSEEMEWMEEFVKEIRKKR